MLLFSECTHRIAQVATVTMRHISLQLQSWNYQCWKQRFAKISQTITEKPLLTRRALIWLKALIGAFSMIVITSQMLIYSSRNYIFTPVVAGCSWRGWRRAHSVREKFESEPGFYSDHREAQSQCQDSDTDISGVTTNNKTHFCLLLSDWSWHSTIDCNVGGAGGLPLQRIWPGNDCWSIEHLHKTFLISPDIVLFLYCSFIWGNASPDFITTALFWKSRNWRSCISCRQKAIKI